MKKLFILLVLSLTSGVYTYAQNPKIVAHRGAWKNTHVPENSIASLNQAISQKVWGSEFDVQLTKDNILVVNHNDDFLGIDIATSTYQELLAKKLENGESIPTLEAYIKEGMKQNDTKLVLELKPSRLGKEYTLKATELTFKLVEELGAQEHVVYISFSYDACLKLRELDSNAHIQYLAFQMPKNVTEEQIQNPAFNQYMAGVKNVTELKTVSLSGFDYHTKLLIEKPELIKQAKDLGLASNVWTANDEQELRFFIDQNIDYITTDEPELLKELLDK